MSKDFAERLAVTLLEDHSHLGEFDVDPMDAEISEMLRERLEAAGCRVDRLGYSGLRVLCPAVACR